MEALPLTVLQAVEHQVEDVVVQFTGVLLNNATRLQQVLLNLGELDVPCTVKVDVNVLAESAAVVVTRRFGIAKCCKNQEIGHQIEILNLYLKVAWYLSTSLSLILCLERVFY